MPPGSIERIIVAVFGGGAAGVAAKALFDYLKARSAAQTSFDGDTQKQLWRRIEELEGQVESLRKHVDEWQGLYHETRAQNELLRQQVEALQEQNHVLRAENQKLKNEVGAEA